MKKILLFASLTLTVGVMMPSVPGGISVPVQKENSQQGLKVGLLSLDKVMEDFNEYPFEQFTTKDGRLTTEAAIVLITMSKLLSLLIQKAGVKIESAQEIEELGKLADKHIQEFKDYVKRKKQGIIG